MRALLTFILLPVLLPRLDAIAGSSPEHSLKDYRSQMASFRKEYGGARELPDIPLFQFGMGLRTSPCSSKASWSTPSQAKSFAPGM